MTHSVVLSYPVDCSRRLYSYISHLLVYIRCCSAMITDEMEDCVDLKPDHDEALDIELNANSTVMTRNGPAKVVMDDGAGWNDPPAISCMRCHDFGCMMPHGDGCGSPYCKFIICPKCQCMYATKSSFEAHVEVCLGQKDGRALDYELHIVQFEEPPCIGLCEICGVYRQRKGSLLDAHRYICQKYIHEHDGTKSPYMPGELKWSVSRGAYAPPHYFHRLLAELKDGGKWSVIEARYFARSGAADCWVQTPSEAFRDPSNRAPVLPGVTMYYRETGDDDDEADTSSMTSCSTVSTVAMSESGQATTANECLAAVATQSPAAPVASTSAVGAEQVQQRSDDGRVAHVEPQRQATSRPASRRKRGRRSGRQVHERQRSSTPLNRSVRSTTLSVESTDRIAARGGRRSPPVVTAAARENNQARSRDNTPRAQEGSSNRRRRPRVAPSPPRQVPQRRVVNEVGDGALEIVSPREDDNGGAERRGAWGDARDVDTPSARRRDWHTYLEGAVVDHRNGNFTASVLVCGVPPNGTSSTVRRNELARLTAVGVSSGLQVSYYKAPADYEPLGEHTLSQARCQALLIDTATRLPAGCFWFWELPPVNGEWLLPTRGDARVNPGADHIKLRFSPLRRG